MARASRFVGFVPVGFLAVIAAIAAVTVLGGWTAESARASSGYGIGWAPADAPEIVAGASVATGAVGHQ